MNEKNFTRLLQERESETLNFKRELPASSDLAVLISAFYNTRSDKVVIGVDDECEPVGLTRPQSVEAGIVNIIRDRLDRDTNPAIEIVAYQGKEFVVVSCQKGMRRDQIVGSLANICWYRHQHYRLITITLFR